jgi:hypothetical protein
MRYPCIFLFSALLICCSSSTNKTFHIPNTLFSKSETWSSETNQTVHSSIILFFNDYSKQVEYTKSGEFGYSTISWHYSGKFEQIKDTLRLYLKNGEETVYLSKPDGNDTISHLNLNDFVLDLTYISEYESYFTKEQLLLLTNTNYRIVTEDKYLISVAQNKILNDKSIGSYEKIGYFYED